MMPEIPLYEEPNLLDLLGYLDKPFGDQELQEAGFVSGLRKLLGKPISRREFLEGAAKEATRKDSILDAAGKEMTQGMPKDPRWTRGREYFFDEILQSMAHNRPAYTRISEE